jgi:hypothetical protein
MDRDWMEECLARGAAPVLTTQQLADYWGVSKRFIETERTTKRLDLRWRKRGHKLICDKAEADARMPGGAQDWCTPREAAELTGWTIRTLEKYRSEGRRQPEWICLGRRIIRYRRAGLTRKRTMK